MPVKVDDIKNIYRAFRKAQTDFKNRTGYRMPKNFEKHFNERMSENNKKSLVKVTGWFITKWSNIDPYDYFSCGFELYKTFSYALFFKEPIIRLYITRDKLKKRKVIITKQKLIQSAKFVKKWMINNNANLEDYINTREGHNRLAVEDYLRNDIDASFLVYLITKGMILTDNERGLMPYVSKNYRKITLEFGIMPKFLKKLGERL